MSRRKSSYDFRKIAADTWMINEFDLGTVYLLAGSERALLIDTSLGLSDLKGLLKYLTPLPIDVVATHGHVDHVGGRGQFPAMYIHKDDVPLVPPIGYLYRRGYAAIMTQIRRYGITPGDVTRPVYDTRLLPVEDGHVFSLGGRDVMVISAPGHTKGSVYLLDRKTRTLFSGDNVNPWLLLNVPGSSTVETHAKAVRWVLEHQREFDRIYCGHGTRAVTIPIVERCLGMAEEAMKAYPKNTRFAGLRRITRAGGKQFYLYRTDRVWNTNEGEQL